MFESGLFTGAFIHFILEENYSWAVFSLILVFLSLYGAKR